MSKRIVSALKRSYKNYRLHNYGSKKDFPLIEGGRFPELSNSEILECKKVWRSFDLKPDDLIWTRIYKKEHGFSPYMVGTYQSCLIRDVLNPINQLHAFDNKAMCDVYFPEIHFAETFVRRIAGVYYDACMNCISLDKAVEILKAAREYVIKPALDTMCGAGVEKIVMKDDDANPIQTIKLSIERQPNDFIAQEVLVQHPDIAALNPSSVNCCRVTTIYIDGKFDYSTILKVGREGGFRDNWNSSYIIGVSKDGITADVGYDDKVNRVYDTDNGLKIGGVRLPKYKEMISMVEHLHKRYFPNCGMIGWDVMVDDKNEIRFIELNVTCPGFVGEQLCSGVFFEPFAEMINRRMSVRK